MRDDSAFLSRLRLLPAGYGIVSAGKAVVPVEVGRLGPQRRWPGTSDPHPLDSRAEVVQRVIGEPYTIQTEDLPWSTEIKGWWGCGPRYAIVDPEVTP